MRLRRIAEEFGDRIGIAWRSYLLRPHADSRRTLEQFRAYTRSWLRPAAESDAPPFRVWQGDAGPPSHSVPPHLAAKAAAALGDAAFDRLHQRLLEAYFSENRDITSADTLQALWGEADLPAAAFGRTGDPALLKLTIDEHNEAVAHGADGVPAVRVEGRDGIVIGAQPVDTYRHWLTRCLAEG